MAEITSSQKSAAITHVALMLAFDSLNNPLNKPAAVQAVLEAHTTAHQYQDTVEDEAVRAAQAIILGLEVDPPAFEPVQTPGDRRQFQTLARAWIRWAANPETAGIFPQSKSQELGSAVHSLVLDQWELALRALFVRDLTEAEKFWARALQLGEQYATESHQVIQWTFVSTFFQRG